ncbi:hypothetical protein PM082_000838 [Marasmius tenuissimus]|nr:hypothetical protein PM082_000838 [Marasmius tenuissimus]
MAASSPPHVPFEILGAIIGSLQAVGDTKALAVCCLVNRAFNAASAPYLYKSIYADLSSIWGRTEKTHKSERYTALVSASLPHNRRRVRVVTISGRLAIGWGVTNLTPPGILIDAFEKFTHLESVNCIVEGQLQIDPALGAIKTQTFSQMWDIIKNLSTIREIVVRWDHIAPVDPALLKQLVKPELLKLTLFGSFDSVDHLANCFGSTPMALSVLRFRVVDYRTSGKLDRLIDILGRPTSTLRNLKVLRLGLLDTSLSDETLFRSLAQLPQLEDLCLEYEIDDELESPYDPMHSYITPIKTFPFLTKLRRFTLRYSYFLEPSLAIGKVCTWIKHVISRCPLEELSFVPFYDMRTWNPLSKPSWDILLDHLTDKHAKTLKSLDLRAAFVKKRSLKRLLDKCVLLEHLAIGTTRGSIHTFVRYSSNLRHLRRVEFELRTLKRGINATCAKDEEVESMLRSAPNLRRVVINEHHWLGTWVLEEGELKYSISKLSGRQLPYSDNDDSIWGDR